MMKMYIAVYKRFFLTRMWETPEGARKYAWDKAKHLYVEHSQEYNFRPVEPMPSGPYYLGVQEIEIEINTDNLI